MRAYLWGNDLDLIFDNETEIGMLAKNGFRLNLNERNVNLEVTLLYLHNSRFSDGVHVASERKSLRKTEIQVTLDHLAYSHLISEAETPRHLSKRTNAHPITRVSIYTPRAYEKSVNLTLH
jgi:hypothetical protein